MGIWMNTIFKMNLCSPWAWTTYGSMFIGLSLDPEILRLRRDHCSEMLMWVKQIYVNLCKSTLRNLGSIQPISTNLGFFLRFVVSKYILTLNAQLSPVWIPLAPLVNQHQFFHAEGGNAIASMHPCRTQQHVCLNSSPRFAGHEEMSYPMMTGFRMWRTSNEQSSCLVLRREWAPSHIELYINIPSFSRHCTRCRIDPNQAWCSTGLMKSYILTQKMMTKRLKM